MTDSTSRGFANSDKIAASLAARHRSEAWFRGIGLAAIVGALGFLAFMVLSIGSTGWKAFQQTFVQLEINFDPAVIDPEGKRDPDVLARANYQRLVRDALRGLFPEVTSRSDRRSLDDTVSSVAQFELMNMVLDDPSIIGTTRKVWLTASDDFDMAFKGSVPLDVPQDERRFSDKQISWMDMLKSQGLLEKQFNSRFFTAGDSREPEQAGILAALVGSMLSLFVCFILSFPVGVLAAVYLEMFAPRNRINDLIEININNLAAVPSIVFGLLGLAMFLGVFGMPRSSPLVGGMVLALMTLPTIIVSARASLKGVPPSLRQAALGLGASQMQAVFHHVVPSALPGMLTGAIIGMAQALGETAPLLLIGMVAFIVDVPQSILEPATALPVQIFLWADSPERGFSEKTAAAILILLGFLVVMNLVAIVMRKKFEQRW
ncbi:MAG: phosphate ABC transporter permease PstA [Proteobacteria bacterium]|nr:phosphate ABC transporter permease PstA [Pseudomonadota bacterium]